ncbi:MarR family transcriptional regulator [Carnobacteriaceae bacterium zg-ZUI252]|nr:MarR family transcriptional regulator [Carnobacteriaceae bacterium zg-ZUI252]
MCDCDCLDKWLMVSASQKKIEHDLEKELKRVTNLTLSEFYVLYFLSQEPQKSMRTFELQEKVGLTQSAMSRLIARMENKQCQYITKGNCSQDKRGVCIKLTAERNALVEQHIHIIEDVLDKNEQFLNQVQWG